MGCDPSVVERYLAALGGQDWPALAACLAADVERTGPYGDVYRGRDAYVAFLAETFASLRGYSLHVARLIGGDEAVAAELSETMDVPEGRRQTHEAVVFDLSPDGLISRVAVYLRRSVIL